MRRVFLTALAFCLVGSLFAQSDSTKTYTKRIVAQPNDHFMIQLGYLSWTGKSDSIHTGGLPRTFNMYVMMEFPFKTNPHFSVAIGPGIGSDNMYFDKMIVGIRDNVSRIPFTNVSDTNNFKKYKLVTAYLEAPIELRYAFNPSDKNKSWKLAIGGKIGTLLSATVKAKDLQNKSGTLLNSYIEKEKSKRFFNSLRFAFLARVGYGHFSLFASYSATQFFTEGLGPKIQPLSIGLTLSGL